MRTLTKTRKICGQLLIVCITWILGGIAGCDNRPDHHVQDETIQVCFSPGGNCTRFIEAAIAKARKTILVQAYFFTSLPIANALVKAHQKGIAVRILVDRSQLTYPYTQAHYMAKKGISVSVDKTSGIAHNKIMIIDDHYVLTGSFNWTKAAEHCNAENILLIKDTKINKIYKEAWHQRARNACKLTKK